LIIILIRSLIRCVGDIAIIITHVLLLHTFLFWCMIHRVDEVHTSVINILNQYFYRSNIMKPPRESYLNCLVLSLELITVHRTRLLHKINIFSDNCYY